jgi:hypothetical protein
VDAPPGETATGWAEPNGPGAGDAGMGQIAGSPPQGDGAVVSGDTAARCSKVSIGKEYPAPSPARRWAGVVQLRMLHGQF